MILFSVLLALLAILGAPLFAVIAASAMIGFYSQDSDLMIMAIEVQSISSMSFLAAIPLFTFAGYLLSESNAPKRLVRLTGAMLGWMPGGLALVCLAACAFFTAFTGASGVTIFALGGLLLPAMLKDGYSERFSMGLITSSGSLGLLFPPSLPLILFGVIAETRIDHLFLAGIIPGFLMLILLCVYAFRSGVVHTREELADQHPLQILKETVWELPLPFIIIIGIYGGFLVAGEAAAVTALYVLIVEVFIYRDIKLRQIPEIMGKSMTLFGGILLILAVSMASTNYLIDQEIPSKIFTFINTYIDSKYTFLLLLNVFLLIVGSILDIFSALVLVVPLILPIAAGYDVNPIHLGIIFLTNLQIGYCTPPVGLNLFLASYRFKRPIFELYRASLPFLGLLLITLVLITYFPWLSLALVEWFG